MYLSFPFFLHKPIINMRCFFSIENNQKLDLKKITCKKMFWRGHLKICESSKFSLTPLSPYSNWELENGTFRQRGEEAATLNPETAPRSHAQAVFLRVLSENHLLQHWGDRSVKKKSRQIVLLALHKQNQWGTIHGSWRRGTLSRSLVSAFATHSSPWHVHCLQAECCPPQHASVLFTDVSQHMQTFLL